MFKSCLCNVENCKLTYILLNSSKSIPKQDKQRKHGNSCFLSCSSNCLMILVDVAAKHFKTKFPVANYVVDIFATDGILGTS